MTTLGPVRSPIGAVMVDVRQDSLVMVRQDAWPWAALSALDRYRLAVVAGMLVLGIGGIYVESAFDGPAGPILIGLGLVCLLLLAVLLIVEVVAFVVAVGWFVGSVLTRRGRRRMSESVSRLRSGERRRSRDAKSTGDWQLQRSDVLSVLPVEGGVRPRLQLSTVRGDVVLSGWPWRRGDLQTIATALGG